MITNIYNEIKSVFGNYFNLIRDPKNCKEFDSFMFYNTLNQKGINVKNHRGIEYLISQNIKTGEKSKFFISANGLCFISAKDNRIRQGKDLINFSINGMEFTCAKSNNNSYFIEKGNLDDKIDVYYYDSVSTKFFEKQKINAHSINSEHEINFFPLINYNYIYPVLKYMPDETIEFKKINNKILITHIKNKEIISQETIENIENRTLYSIYYEYMNKTNSYNYGNQNENCKKRFL